jgi:hypothetical protein
MSFYILFDPNSSSFVHLKSKKKPLNPQQETGTECAERERLIMFKPCGSPY